MKTSSKKTAVKKSIVTAQAPNAAGQSPCRARDIGHRACNCGGPDCGVNIKRR